MLMLHDDKRKEISKKKSNSSQSNTENVTYFLNANVTCRQEERNIEKEIKFFAIKY